MVWNPFKRKPKLSGEEYYYMEAKSAELIQFWDQALKSYDKALMINPEYEEAWSGKGIVLGKLGKYEESLVCSQRQLDINPHNAEAWYNMGITLGSMDRRDEQMACYDKALEFNPDYAEAWYNKGVRLEDAGKYKESIESYENFLKCAPAELSSLKPKVKTYIEQLQSKIKEA